jgi:hypothetical protein
LPAGEGQFVGRRGHVLRKLIAARMRSFQPPHLNPLPRRREDGASQKRRCNG